MIKSLVCKLCERPGGDNSKLSLSKVVIVSVLCEREISDKCVWGQTREIWG